MKFVPDTCVEIENLLPLWVGQDLDPEARSRVEAHLAECERCSTRAGAALRARSALREQLASGAEPGPDVWPAVRATLVAERLLPRDGVRVEPESRRDLLRFWPVAAVAAALLAVWLVGRWNDGNAAEPDAGSNLVHVPTATVGSPIQPDTEQPGGITFVNLRAGGLRRLNADEAHLADGDGPTPLDAKQDGPRPLSPAGLQRVVPNW